ncbi:MAG: CotH kinase family protein [Bacteroidota bacterium]
MKKNIYCILLAFICLMSYTSIRSQTLVNPTFSVPVGFYTDSVAVAISSTDVGVQIRYTLNGDDPTITSPLYTGLLILRNRVGTANVYANIPTNPSFDFPKPGYTATRADDRGWLPPASEVAKCWVLKARAFDVLGNVSPISFATYFIFPEGTNRYSLPCLSIAMNVKDLFSDTTGMYVYGIDTADEGNYNFPYFEKGATIQLFDALGNLQLTQNCAATMHGNGGRHAPQKSIQFTAQSVYGPSKFNVQLFPDNPVQIFNSFLLRNGGHRLDCIPRDDIASRLLKTSTLDHQDSKQYVIFLNGEYWGIQTIKDIIDEDYMENHYQIDKDSVAILELDGVVDDGLPNDHLPYLSLLNFVRSNDMSIPSNLEYVNTQIDIKSFIDFQSTEIYFGNGDWPNNNTKFWRNRLSINRPTDGNKLDGRWHWIVYDMDAGFGGDCSGVYYTFNNISKAFNSAYGDFTILMRTLINNNQFKTDFLNRFSDLLNAPFKSSLVSTEIKEVTDVFDPEMKEHVERWRYPSMASTLISRSTEVPDTVKWNIIRQDLQKFASKRPNRNRMQLMTYFNLTDTFHVTINVNDTAAGHVKFSTLFIDKKLPAVNENPYPWEGVYFGELRIPLKAIAMPGYKFLYWEGIGITNPDTSVFLSSDTTFTAVFGIDSSFHPKQYVFINELCSNGGTYEDWNLEKDDWFEIYNPHDFPVDIAGYYLSDDPLQLNKFQLVYEDTASIIPAFGHKIIWADNQPWQGSLHTNFKLSSSGESIWLTLPNETSVVDSVYFGPVISSHSWGREHDAANNWIEFIIPTPADSNHIILPNSIAQYQYPSDPLRIYPNPSTTNNFIYFNRAFTGNIFNGFGQLIQRLENSVDLNIKAYQAGVYLFREDTGNTFKWIKLND